MKFEFTKQITQIVQGLDLLSLGILPWIEQNIFKHSSVFQKNLLVYSPFYSPYFFIFISFGGFIQNTPFFKLQNCELLRLPLKFSRVFQSSSRSPVKSLIN